MKKLWIVSMLVLAVLSCKTQKDLKNVITGNYNLQWEQIEEYIKKGFPEKAISALDELIIVAKGNNDHTVATRAILRKVSLKNLDQDDFIKEQVPYLEKTLAETDDPISASFLNYVLALVYHHYWESNQNTIPFKSSGDDEWDGEAYRNVTDSLINNSLTEDNKSVLIKDVGEYFSELPYNAKMTLWDFFLLEKIDIYKSGAYGKLLGEDVRRTAVTELYDVLMSKLSSKHQDKILAETIVAKQAFLNENINDFNGKFPESYDYILTYHQGLELLQEAQQLESDRSLQSQKFVESLKKFNFVKTHQDSIYQNNAQASIERIKEVELQVQVEQVVIPNSPSLSLLTSKNLDKVYVKIYQLTKKDYLENRRVEGFPYKGKPIAHENVIVIPEAPFQYTKQTTEISIPKLTSGYYGIVVNTSENFEIGGNEPLYQANFLVSNLAINSYFDPVAMKMNLECINRTSGDRIEGASFKIYDRQYNRRIDGQNLITIYEGVGSPIFSYAPIQQKNHYPFVEVDGQYFMISDGLFQYNSVQRSHVTANILTDRAIYRPGQKVYFQGILYKINSEKLPTIQTNVKFEIEISDNFGNKLETIQLKADEFGAFDGNFSISETTQNGTLNFRFVSKETRIDAYKSIRVEEYKRPKFEVIFEDISQDLKLGENVKVSAMASSYTGVPVVNAKITYKVYRSAWWPYFYRGYRSSFPSRFNQRDLIISGTTSSSSQGKIDFAFKAEKSLDNPEIKNFQYVVEMEVVDQSGETKIVDKTLNISTQSVFIKFEKAEEEGSYRLSTVNAEDQPIQANVNIDIYKQREEGFQVNRYWNFPDSSIVDREDFPDYRFVSTEQDYSASIYSATLTVKDTVLLDLKDIVGTGSFKIDLKSEGETAITQKFEILDFDANQFGSEQLFYVEKMAEKYGVGDVLNFRVGSNIAGLKVQIQEYKDGKLIREEWKAVNGSFLISDQINEKDFGGFSYVIKSYFKNRVNSQDFHIEVPWTHKDLVIKPKTIRYVTEPGSPEKWTFLVTDYEGKPVRSRFLSSMYDASLDEFQPHNWNWNLYPNYQGTPYARNFSYNSLSLHSNNYSWGQGKTTHRHFEIAPIFDSRFLRFINSGNIMYQSGIRLRRGAMDEVRVESAAMEMDSENKLMAPIQAGSEKSESGNLPPSPPPPPPANVRTNLSELVFFYPNLKTNDQGEVGIEFTNNEALTQWKLQNFAFTKDLKFGFSSEEIVTKKELMIQANQPRFLRSGDKIYLSAKLINLSETDQKVMANLSINNEIDKKDIDIKSSKKDIILKKGEQKDVIWEVNVPQDFQLAKLIYSVSGEHHEDAEQHVIPVVPNEIYLIDSETILLNAQSSGSVDVQAMLKGKKRTSAFTIESTGSPAWYAVRSLPYLMENDNENSEAIFNRYFANALALKILEENPLVEKYYKEWKDRGNLHSQLSLNSELKKMDLSATPWLQDALSEEENMVRMANFFDKDKVKSEMKLAMQKLKSMQHSSGGFPWYQGGRLNYYMSQYILEGFLRLEELGTGEVDNNMKANLYRFCAEEAVKLDWNEKNSVPSILIKNAWINEVEAGDQGTSYATLLKKVRALLAEKWYEFGLEDQVYIAKIFKRENRALTDEIAASLIEKSFYKEQLGRFWNRNSQMIFSSWDINLQASMISLFNELGGHENAIDEMKFWLIANKRTNNWRSTIATSSAIYALSLGSSSSFSEGKPIQTVIDGVISSSNAIIGMNYEKETLNDLSRVNSMKEIVFDNPNKNKAWANVHHQFFQNYEDVERTENEFLDIKKEMYRVGLNDELENVIGEDLNLGDRVKVRLIIEVDRPMQFVHISDERPGGAEPMDASSGYQWGNRLNYYKSVKDLGTHFFVDFLNKGRHVIEYDMFINNLGEFNSGVAEIQNMYAPEFNDYSKSVRIKVK